MDPTMTVISMITSIATGIVVAWANRRATRWEDRRKAERELDRAEHEMLMEHLAAYDKKLDKVVSAQQKSMRSDLMHRSEKYITRGWITPEEHLAMYDLYEAYEGLGKNGFIRAYMQKIDKLEKRRTL